MKYKITFEFDSVEEMRSELGSMIKYLEKTEDAAPVKKTKKAAPMVEPEDDEDEELPVKKVAKKKPVAMVDDEDEDEDDAPEQPTKDDVIAAFKAYVKKAGKGDNTKGRGEAKKVLKKFKASTVDELDEGEYSDVIAALK